METTQTSISEKVISRLREAATELEELQLQFALGKAEARDKFEEIKKTFREYLAEAKEKAKSFEKKTDHVKSKLESLRVQLALGRAEGIAFFQEQKKNILAAIHNLEASLTLESVGVNRDTARLKSELEKLKLKLEILEGEFNRKKKESPFNLDELKENVKNKFNEAKATLMGDTKPGEKWDAFSKEVEEAYKHLKKAFTKF